MKAYKTEDISVTEFSQNLQSRIDQLERKIRMLRDDENVYQDGLYCSQEVRHGAIKNYIFTLSNIQVLFCCIRP
jgi:hypothetical protein